MRAPWGAETRKVGHGGMCRRWRGEGWCHPGETPGRTECWPAIPRLIPRGLIAFLSLTGVSGSPRSFLTGPRKVLTDRHIRRVHRTALLRRETLIETAGDGSTPPAAEGRPSPPQGRAGISDVPQVVRYVRVDVLDTTLIRTVA